MTTGLPAQVDRPSESRWEQYVIRQLRRAGTQIKWVDLIGALAGLVVVLLGTLLAVCILDAWVVPLPSAVRLAVVVGLGAYIVGVLLRAVVPLIRHRINPAYSAQMIEQSRPSLKNILLSYLTLREPHASRRNLVYEAVEQRAASELSSIPIEATVDRSHLIRVGFLLVGVVAACGLYTLLSPKSPLQTIARVVAPMSDLPQPSRVRMGRVRPGDAEVAFGESLEVTAEIRGVPAGEPVALIFTTDDRQIVSQSILLEPGEARYEYRGVLTTSPAGIQQALTYHVAAGDGRSSDYRVSVQPSPAIAVEAVEVAPPAYTELPRVRQEGRGDLRAIEGSQVRIEAAANVPVAAAYVELLRAPTEDAAPVPAPESLVSVERIALDAAGGLAAEFRLTRAAEGPRYTHYRLVMTAADGRTNRNPPLHALDVYPDMAPELEILAPAQQQISVPVDGRLRFELSAADPDFRLSALRVQVAHKGRLLHQQNVEFDPPTGQGRVRASFDLRPQAVQLKAGDEAVVYFTALDNRVSAASGQPDPNQTRSLNYTVAVTAGAPPGQRGNDREGDASSPSGDSAPSGDSSPQAQGDSGGGGEDGGEAQPSEQAGGSGSGKTSSQSDPNAEEPSSGQSGGTGAEPSDPNQSQTGNPSGGERQPSDPSNPNDPPDPVQPGAQASEPAANDQADPNRPNPGEPGQSTGNPSGSGESQPSGPPNESQHANGEGAQPGDSAEATDGARQPLGESATDGERWDRVIEHMRQQEDRDRIANSETQRAAEASRPSNPAGENPDQPPSDSNDSQRGESAPERAAGQPPPGDAQEPPGESRERSGGEPAENAAQPASPSERSEPGDSQPPSAGDRHPSGQQPSGANQPSERSEPAGGDPESPSDPSGQGQPDSMNPAADADQPAGSNRTGDQEGGQEPSPRTDPDREEPGAGDERGTEGDPSTANDAQPSGERGNGEGPAGDPATEPNSDRGEDSPPQPRGDAQGGESQPGESQGGERQDPSGDGGQPSAASNADSPREPGQPNPGNQLPRAMPEGDAQPSDLSGGPPTAQERQQLEASRQVTELALEYLKNQQRSPDPDLLGELNWTEQELQRFVERWEQMRQAAAAGEVQAVRRYEEALQSLGLQTVVGGPRRATMRDNRPGPVSEDSAVSRPPARFEQQYRDFLRGRSRGESSRSPDVPQ